jgi:TetR/AcrR family transcriptional regulator, lmrAB and yxaGH operons repressor
MRARKQAAPAADARERMLEAAILLMRQSGLTGAGINQVLARSDAPKGSIYYYFPQGKQQVAAEALTLYASRVAAAFERVLASKRKPADKIRALFRFVADRLEEGAFEQSCAAGAVTLDLDADVAALQPVVAATFASWRAVVASHLPIKSRARRESIAGLVISTIEGAYIRGRAERSKSAFLEAAEWLAVLVERECGAAGRR